jgi:hypothetical protein
MSTQKFEKEVPELLSISRIVDAPYNYNAGFYISKYLKELKDHKRFIAVRCPKCKKVYVPPRPVCGPCFTKMEEFVHVSDKGMVMAFAVTNVPYTNPSTGEPKEIPFTCAYIKLEGADSNIMHILEKTEEKNLKIGMRVQAVFNDIRTGDHFTDIKHFKIIG